MAFCRTKDGLSRLESPPFANLWKMISRKPRHKPCRQREPATIRHAGNIPRHNDIKTGIMRPNCRLSFNGTKAGNTADTHCRHRFLRRILTFIP